MTREEILSKAKPILFNTDMVRAILDDTKTVTRRVLKTNKYIPNDAVFGYTAFTPEGCISCRGTFFDESRERYGESFIKLPYQVGDILYVRETFCPFDPDHVINGVKYAYRADATAESERARKDFGYKWKPSIHMPKKATRIFLKVTSVSVERLQDIIKDDCLTPTRIHKEGVSKPCILCIHPDFDCRDYIENKRCDLMDKYEDLWNSAIKKSDLEKYGWDANPWVTVNEFERVVIEK